MSNLDVNFVLSEDYDEAVNQLRVLPESRIRDWMETPGMTPTQRRAMGWVLGEKEMLRHREVVERLDRLRDPHWTTTPVFWATVVGAIAAGLAAVFGYPAFLQWISDSRPPSSDTQPTRPASSEPPSSLSTPPPVPPQSPATKE